MNERYNSEHKGRVIDESVRYVKDTLPNKLTSIDNNIETLNNNKAEKSSIPKVIDSLNETSASDALSAKQGNVLNSLITSLTNFINSTTGVLGDLTTSFKTNLVGAINEVFNVINIHKDNDDVHVTVENKDEWDEISEIYKGTIHYDDIDTVLEAGKYKVIDDDFMPAIRWLTVSTRSFQGILVDCRQTLKTLDYEMTRKYSSGTWGGWEEYTFRSKVTSNLRDGNGSGSVRGVNTSDNYTMGSNAFATGLNTKAAGTHSNAHGYNTIAKYRQFVIGTSNIESEASATGGNNTHELFIIGNGSGSSSRSNAFSVLVNGIINIYADIHVKTAGLLQTVSQTIIGAINETFALANSKADPYVAGDNINIVGNVISAIGGGGGSVNDATTEVRGILRLSGDLTGTANDPELINTGVISGSYTNADITVDSKGRIIEVNNGSSGTNLDNDVIINGERVTGSIFIKEIDGKYYFDRDGQRILCYENGKFYAKLLSGGGSSKPAYQEVVDRGYTGTENEFYESLMSIGDINTILDNIVNGG